MWLICLALVGLVLIQQGQGAEAGAAFGSGSSQTVFGSRGAGSFLTRLTGWPRNGPVSDQSGAGVSGRACQRTGQRY